MGFLDFRSRREGLVLVEADHKVPDKRGVDNIPDVGRFARQLLRERVPGMGILLSQQAEHERHAVLRGVLLLYGRRVACEQVLDHRARRVTVHNIWNDLA